MERTITYAQASTAKALGFDQKCRQFWIKNSESPITAITPDNFNRRRDVLSAPSQDEFAGWLRDVHDVHISVRPIHMLLGKTITQYREINIFCRESYFSINLDEHKYDSYEDIMEVAIELAVEGLQIALKKVEIYKAES